MAQEQRGYLRQLLGLDWQVLGHHHCQCVGQTKHCSWFLYRKRETPLTLIGSKLATSRAAVEEQASARKLLPPLLFKLPVKVGDQKDPWIAQLYVHQGDVPAQIAASFVRQRHLPARPPSSCDATIAWLLLQLFRAHQLMRGRWASTPSSRHTHVSVPVPSCPRVHQVSRYSGWGNATETVQTITAAIVAKAGTINEAIEDAATRKEGQAEGATAAGV